MGRQNEKKWLEWLKTLATYILVFFPFVAIFTNDLRWSYITYYLLRVWAIVFIIAVVVGVYLGFGAIISEHIRIRKRRRGQ